jgi:hypothetical protein
MCSVRLAAAPGANAGAREANCRRDMLLRRGALHPELSHPAAPNLELDGERHISGQLEPVLRDVVRHGPCEHRSVAGAPGARGGAVLHLVPSVEFVRDGVEHGWVSFVSDRRVRSGRVSRPVRSGLSGDAPDPDRWGPALTEQDAPGPVGPLKQSSQPRCPPWLSVHVRCTRPAQESGASRWGEQDSNLRRLSQRVYSPSPLTTRTSPRACCAQAV